MSILTEILRDMYVDPELLEQLSMEQRDVLFRKMREEQIRRWRLKEDQLEEDQLEEKERGHPPRRMAPKVKFLKGADGNVPWVWVMGEHKDDLSYEELVRRREEEEMERERQSELELRKEAEELAKNETRQIMSLAKKFGELKSSKQGDLTTDGAAAGDKASIADWTKFARSESEMLTADTAQQSPQMGHMKKMHTAESEEQVRRKTLERRVSIIGSTDKEQREYEKKRADEVFSTLLRVKRIAKRRAQEIANQVEQQWKESEQKAKDYEQLRRTSFKKARELTAKSPNVPEKILEQIPSETKNEIAHRISARRKPLRKAPLPPQDRPLIRKSSIIQPGTAPKTFYNVVRWFQENEAPRGVGREKDGSISVWFHGKLTRGGSQKLLDSKPAGSYLVRLSTKIWGYTVSVQSYTGVKHFLIDASTPEAYHFLGPKQQKFKSIPDLLGFYRVNPITWAGQEVLLLPIGQEDETSSLTADVFQGLYTDDDMAMDTYL